MENLKLSQIILELESREKLLDDREKLLKDANLEIAVLDAKISVNNNNLENLKKSFKSTEDAMNEMVISKRAVIKELENTKDSLNKDIEKLKEEKESLQYVIQNLESTKKQINKEIKERKSYFDEQEESIAKACDIGNEKLLDLRQEAGLLTSNIEKLDQQNLELQDKITDQKFQLVELEDAEKVKQFEYKEELDVIKSKIEEAKQQLKDITERNDSITKDTADKLKSIKVAELSLEAKLSAYRKDKEELEIKKRRFNSAESLYN